MPNWCTNIILISGPIEDVSVLYKSLEEYDAEVKANKEKEPGKDLFNIYSWIKAKFSDKLPTFTEDDYALSYRNFIEDYSYSEEDADDKEAHLDIYTYSAWTSRMYALVKLIEVGFPKCIIHYVSEEPGFDYYINTDESGYYFQDRWYYCNYTKSDYYMSDEELYNAIRYDYADIIKDNNIVAPALIDPGQDQICKLVESLVEFDESLCVYPYSIGPEYDDKKVEILKGIIGKVI